MSADTSTSQGHPSRAFGSILLDPYSELCQAAGEINDLDADLDSLSEIFIQGFLNPQGASAVDVSLIHDVNFNDSPTQHAPTEFEMGIDLLSTLGMRESNILTPIEDHNSNLAQTATDESATNLDEAMKAADTFSEKASKGKTFDGSFWHWNPRDRTKQSPEPVEHLDAEDEVIGLPDMAHRKKCLQLEPCIRLRESKTRDALLSLFIKFSRNDIALRSFPSADLLSILLQAYFTGQKSSLYSWIHAGTFDADSCRRELLLAMIGSGSMLIAEPKVRKLGYVLQENVMKALFDAFGREDRGVRDLQDMQAFALWMETGLWCGFNRRMEIADAFASLLPTVSPTPILSRDVNEVTKIHRKDDAPRCLLPSSS